MAPFRITVVKLDNWESRFVQTVIAVASGIDIAQWRYDEDAKNADVILVNGGEQESVADRAETTAIERPIIIPCIDREERDRPADGRTLGRPISYTELISLLRVLESELRIGHPEPSVGSASSQPSPPASIDTSSPDEKSGAGAAASDAGDTEPLGPASASSSAAMQDTAPPGKPPPGTPGAPARQDTISPGEKPDSESGQSITHNTDPLDQAPAARPQTRRDAAPPGKPSASKPIPPAEQDQTGHDDGSPADSASEHAPAASGGRKSGAGPGLKTGQVETTPTDARSSVTGRRPQTRKPEPWSPAAASPGVAPVSPEHRPTDVVAHGHRPAKPDSANDKAADHFSSEARRHLAKMERPAKRFFEDTRMLGMLKRLVHQDQPIKITHPAFPSITVFPSQRCYACDSDLTKMPRLFRTSSLEFFARKVTRQPSTATGNEPLWKLFYCAALYGSEGRLMAHYHPDDKLQLIQQPDFEVVPTTGEHRSLGERMCRGMSSIEEIATSTGIDIKTVIDFCNACAEIGLVSGHAAAEPRGAMITRDATEQSEPDKDTESTAATDDQTGNTSLLERMRLLFK